MGVDEAWSDQATCTVDDAGPGRDVDITDRNDPPALHDDGPAGWVVPVAVEQGGADEGGDHGASLTAGRTPGSATNPS